MKIDYAFFSKFLDLNSDGTFTAVGAGVEGLGVESLPARIPTITLLAKLLLSSEEIGRKHEIWLEATDPEGKPVGANSLIEVNVEPGASVAAGTAGAFVSFGFFNFEFHKPGRYEFRLRVGEEPLGTCYFTVGQPPERSGAMS